MSLINFWNFSKESLINDAENDNNFYKYITPAESTISSDIEIINTISDKEIKHLKKMMWKNLRR